MIREIDLDGRTVSYCIERKNVKNINLRIKPDKSIFVSADCSVPDSEIEEFIRSKSKVIIRSLTRFEEISRYTPQPKKYIDGETFILFGHELRLKVKAGNENSVECDEVFITLTVEDENDREVKSRVMDSWLNGMCKAKVSSICDAIYPKFKKYGITFPKLQFRNMVSRWGSCQPKTNTLTFNYALVEMPVCCVEYVVMHEFVHLLYPNHSKEFYLFLSAFMPDWRERKSKLEKRAFL